MSGEGVLVWFTGLPSSGKSTLSLRVRDALAAKGRPVAVLDGDDVRNVLVPKVGYSEPEREAFYATLAGLGALLAAQGLTVLVPATANKRAFRERARALCPRFVEVFVSTPPEECALRDAKGLYASSERGGVSALPGVGAAYEPPLSPEVIAPHGADDDAVRAVLAALEVPSPE